MLLRACCAAQEMKHAFRCSNIMSQMNAICKCANAGVRRLLCQKTLLGPIC